MLIVWNASSSIVNTGPIKVKLCHCNVLFSGSTRSQSAIEVILVSNEADLRADSNDSSPMCISCKITTLFKLFLHQSEHEHTKLVCLQFNTNKHCVHTNSFFLYTHVIQNNLRTPQLPAGVWGSQALTPCHIISLVHKGSSTLCYKYM